MFFGKHLEKPDNPEKNKEVKPRNQILQTEPVDKNKKLEKPEKSPHDKFVEGLRVPDSKQPKLEPNKRKPVDHGAIDPRERDRSDER